MSLVQWPCQRTIRLAIFSFHTRSMSRSIKHAYSTLSTARTGHQNGSEGYPQKPSGRDSVYLPCGRELIECQAHFLNDDFPWRTKIKRGLGNPDKFYAAQDCTGSQTHTIPLSTTVATIYKNIHQDILVPRAPSPSGKTEQTFLWLWHCTYLPNSSKLSPRRVIRSGCLRRALLLMTIRLTHAKPTTLRVYAWNWY